MTLNDFNFKVISYTPVAKGGVSRVNPRKIFWRGRLKSLGLYLWYKCTKMHHFNTKTPQITVRCKMSYDIVFILLSVQNLVSWFSGKSSKLLPKTSDFKSKMHKIRCRLGPPPQTSLGSLQRSHRPLSWIEGALLLRGGRRREGKGRTP